MDFGVQMFGIGKLWQEDPCAFPEKVRQLGFAQVEPCVFLGGEMSFQVPGIWDKNTLIREAERLKTAGIGIPSAHVFATDWDKALPDMQQLARQYGIRHFVLKCPETVTRLAYAEFAAKCVRMALALQTVDACLLLHNEKADIEGKIEGKTAYEWVLDTCEGQVFAQVDVGWALAGGEKPEALLWRNEALVRSVHYKDFSMADQPKEVLIGTGEADIPACFQFARAHGIPQILDMDTGDEDAVAKAGAFLATLPQYRANTSSILCILDTETKEITQLHRFDGIIEAPNWLANGDELLFNADGDIWRYSIAQDRVIKEEIPGCGYCNNDHALSWDNRYLGISQDPDGGYASQVFAWDFEKKELRQLTTKAPSFLHGWSPDGKYLVYCAFRPGKTMGGMDIDLYKIPSQGGEEIRLTQGEGYNDGSEYAPDGKTIWFNSTRSGLMQVWRIGENGENPQQMTFSEANNWFPHVSPDGKKVVYLTFTKGELDPMEHLPNMQVQLGMMNADGTEDHQLIRFFGGQGSINVNSWAPDSRRIAFVMYELHHL